MVKRYGSKRHKALAAKGQVAKEVRSDLELFPEVQTKWEEDSPHHLVMLYEMFKHATDEGWKEAE